MGCECIILATVRLCIDTLVIALPPTPADESLCSVACADEPTARVKYHECVLPLPPTPAFVFSGVRR